MLLADAVVAHGVRPLGDGGLCAPGFASRLRAHRVQRAGNEIDGRLHVAIALERGLARRCAAHADRFSRDPAARAVLLGLAGRAERCAERLTAALGEVGGSGRTAWESPEARATDRVRIDAEVDELRAATERYLDDACAVARHQPWLSRLLVAIREEKAEDLRELLRLLARLGPDRPNDAGSAPVPAVVEPDLDPVIGRKILDLPL